MHVDSTFLHLCANCLEFIVNGMRSFPKLGKKENDLRIDTSSIV